MREIITLVCTKCKQKNYTSTKDKQGSQGRLELKKYCRFCHGHVLHREAR